MSEPSTTAAIDGLQRLAENVSAVLAGRQNAAQIIGATFLARGHLLMEDVPGVGKTTTGKALAASVAGSWGRIQFTPDLLPSDLTGVTIYRQETATFDFHPGPLFHTVVIGDEINRASPKTQSALLECMAERQVTVDGTSHALPDPFMVIATQNPVEMDGTYRLPEAHVASKEVEQVHASDAVLQYILALVRATRTQANLALGLSPRAGLHMVRLAKSLAFLHGRDHVLPDDVQLLAPAAWAHRLLVTRSGRVEGVAPEEVLRHVVDEVPVTG